MLDGGTQNLQVRVPGAFHSMDELRRMPIRGLNPATGQASSIQLGDIADIRGGVVDPPVTKVRHQGKPVIALGVAMAKGGDIIALSKSLRTKVDAIRANLPAGITLEQLQAPPPPPRSAR